MCGRDNHRVQALTTDLEPVTQSGSKGSGDGQFNELGSIAVDDGMLFVSDRRNDCVTFRCSLEMVSLCKHLERKEVDKENSLLEVYALILVLCMSWSLTRSK